MSLTYGFFNSINGDRRYNAEEFSQFFDGIINDGVFDNVGELFAVVAGTGLQVIVKTGRAWFNGTWTLNDAWIPLAIERADIGLPRKDAVVIEVNHEDDVRANSIKVIRGDPEYSPQPPELIDTSKVHQYPIAYVNIPANSTTIGSIENLVGTLVCPFVTGILETVDISVLFSQWNEDFAVWFNNLKSQMSGNVAANLQAQIDQCVKIVNKATPDEVVDGTNDDHYLTPKSAKALTQFAKISGIKNGAFDLGATSFSEEESVILTSPISSGTGGAPSISGCIIDVKKNFAYLSGYANVNSTVNAYIWKVNLTTKAFTQLCKSSNLYGNNSYYVVGFDNTYNINDSSVNIGNVITLNNDIFLLSARTTSAYEHIILDTKNDKIFKLSITDNEIIDRRSVIMANSTDIVIVCLDSSSNMRYGHISRSAFSGSTMSFTSTSINIRGRLMGLGVNSSKGIILYCSKYNDAGEVKILVFTMSSGTYAVGATVTASTFNQNHLADLVGFDNDYAYLMLFVRSATNSSVVTGIRSTVAKIQISNGSNNIDTAMSSSVLNVYRTSWQMYNRICNSVICGNYIYGIIGDRDVYGGMHNSENQPRSGAVISQFKITKSSGALSISPSYAKEDYWGSVVYKPSMKTIANLDTYLIFDGGCVVNYAKNTYFKIGYKRPVPLFYSFGVHDSTDSSEQYATRYANSTGIVLNEIDDGHVLGMLHQTTYGASCNVLLAKTPLRQDLYVKI